MDFHWGCFRTYLDRLGLRDRCRFTILGPLLLLAGVGYAGAGAVPVLVAHIAGPDATWEDLSLPWQLGISALIAVGLFVLYLVVWSLLP